MLGAGGSFEALPNSDGFAAGVGAPKPPNSEGVAEVAVVGGGGGAGEAGLGGAGVGGAEKKLPLPKTDAGVVGFWPNIEGAAAVAPTDGGFCPNRPPEGIEGGVKTGGGAPLKSDVKPGVPGPESEGAGEADGVSGFAVSADLPATGDGDLLGGVNVGAVAGARVKGASFGGATEAPNSTGGVFGLLVLSPGTGIAGDAERAFLDGEAAFSSSSASSSASPSSSSPLIGRLARGELRTGRVEGRPGMRSPPEVLVGVDVGGAEVARVTGAVDCLITGTGDPASAGEPGGVVLRSRTGVDLDDATSDSFEGDGEGEEKIDGGGLGLVGCFTVGDPRLT